MNDLSEVPWFLTACTYGTSLGESSSPLPLFPLQGTILWHHYFWRKSRASIDILLLSSSVWETPNCTLIKYHTLTCKVPTYVYKCLFMSPSCICWNVRSMGYMNFTCIRRGLKKSVGFERERKKIWWDNRSGNPAIYPVSSWPDTWSD